MNRPEVEKLLGGYATGTLTPAEEQALFAAALEDQHLFDELMGEQPLRDLLGDPAARASLLAALSERPAPWYRRFARPLIAVAALLVVAVPVAIWQASRRPQAQPVLTAQIAEPPKAAEQRDAVPAPPAPPPGKVGQAISPARRRKAAAVPKKPAAEPAAKAPEITTQAKDVSVSAEAAQLKTASKPETVEITAQTGEVQLTPTVPAPPVTAFAPAQQSARLNAPAALAMLAARSPVRYTVLRRNEDGVYVAVDPNDLHAGDIVKLHLESTETGYVYVSEQKNLLVQSPVEPGKPFETTIAQQSPGTRLLQIHFSPRPVIWNTTAFGKGALGGAAAPAGFAGAPPQIILKLEYK